jgi:sulfur-carrier protein adenylyltransferase/sulfurtransferase
MTGGIKAWEGLTAEGAPEAGMAYFTVASGPEELIGLAWALEEGSRRFYAELTRMNEDADAVRVFQGLTAAEEGHKASLAELYKDLSGIKPDSEFPGTSVATEASGDIMEGGMRVSEALTWAKGKGLQETLELAISLETNSYDLYLKMENRMEDKDAGRVFARIAKEEKNHLSRLADLLDMKL